MHHLGVTWPALAERVERSGRWLSWVGAEPDLALASGLEELVAMAEDRADPRRADLLLAALVRLGAVDGGNDHDAAQAVALLLTNGAARLARELRNLSADIEDLVAGQVWLQIREFPWRRRRRAIAQNILMDARRAVLADLGVDTRSRGRGLEVILVDTIEVEAMDSRSHILADHDRAPSGDELTLVAVLQWATGKGVVRDWDAVVLLELAGLEMVGAVRGLSCAAEISAVAARLGVNEKTVRRSRDRALRCLVEARAQYLRECA
jgi:ribosomal protein S18 acetylase RimI-like enzyme